MDMKRSQQYRIFSTSQTRFWMKLNKATKAEKPSLAGEEMISRIWHGWTIPQNADKYETLLKEEIFIGIHNREIHGFKGIQLLRREIDHEVEFVTILAFESLDAVHEFAGEDYEVAVVPGKARSFLSRFDERSQHYEIVVERTDLPVRQKRLKLFPFVNLTEQKHGQTCP